MRHLFVALLLSAFLLLSDYLVTQRFSPAQGATLFLFLSIASSLLAYRRIIFLALVLLGYAHHLFHTYFRREIAPVDIRLFFTHTEETFETFWSTAHLYLLPTALVLAGVALVWGFGRISAKTYPLRRWKKVLLFTAAAAIAMNASSGMRLAGAAARAVFFESPERIEIEEVPLYPRRTSDATIVLVIGESMKFSEKVEKHLQKSGRFYKKIYAGATNTDVSLPLLLNGKNDPLRLGGENETNLFRLAKKNGYLTTFVSVQSAKSLRYIEPYLQKSFIDRYETHTESSRKPLYDFLLYDALASHDFSKKNFIVFQQIGEHSPYIYYPGDKSEKISVNYDRSVDYSFLLYRAMMEFLDEEKKPYIFVMTSDHGEFTGEGGRYGHNCFDPVVYEVPLLISANVPLPDGYERIVSHYHLWQLLVYLLGYGGEFSLSEAPAVVNGTMQSREDGFIVIRGDGRTPDP